jgi:hypothetical protein
MEEYGADEGGGRSPNIISWHSCNTRWHVWNDRDSGCWARSFSEACINHNVWINQIRPTALHMNRGSRTSIAMWVERCAISTTKHSSARDLDGLVTRRWLRIETEWIQSFRRRTFAFTIWNPKHHVVHGCPVAHLAFEWGNKWFRYYLNNAWDIGELRALKRTTAPETTGAVVHETF